MAIRGILKNPGARRAFETLCKKGCDREWLATRILGVRHERHSKTRKVAVDLKECRRLSKALARLRREFEDPRVLQWCLVNRQLPLLADSKEPLFRYTNLSDLFATSKTAITTADRMEFDTGILRAQLQSAADYFRHLGNQQGPVLCYVEIGDFNLRRFLSYVKERTGTEHYNEISILCEAAGNGRSVDALKQSAYRARKK